MRVEVTAESLGPRGGIEVLASWPCALDKGDDDHYHEARRRRDWALLASATS